MCIRDSADASHGLRWRSEDDRVELLKQCAFGEQRGRNFGVGRTAGIEQQAAVLRLCRCLDVDAQPIDQARRNQGALEAVLEKQSDCQIRRQAQASDYLSGADLIKSCRGRLQHDLTLLPDQLGVRG